MGEVIARATADLREGRLWAARDRLAGALVDRADDELLGLLGDVHYRMGDLPKAGAIWFVTDRSGPEAEAAAAAWRTRHGGDALELWRSIPSSVRRIHEAKLVELRARAVTSAKGRKQRTGPLPEGDPALEATSTDWFEVVAFGSLVVGLALLVIGLGTVMRWIF